MKTSISDEDVLAIGPVLRESSGVLRRIVLRTHSDGLYRLSTDEVLQEPSSNPPTYFTVCSYAGDYLPTTLEEACGAFATRLEIETHNFHVTYLRTLKPESRCVDKRLFALLGWAESSPSDNVLRSKLRSVVWKNVKKSLERSVEFPNLYLMLLLLLVCATGYHLMPEVFSTYLIGIIVFAHVYLHLHPEIVSSALTTHSARRKHYLEMLKKKSRCGCGALDVKQFGDQGVHRRVCPKCFPHAAIAAEIDRPNDDVDRELLREVVEEYFGAETNGRINSDQLVGQSVFALHDGLLAYNPWHTADDEELRLALKYVDQAYVVVIECKVKASDSITGTRVICRYGSFLDAVMGFTLRLKLLGSGKHVLPTDGPYNGATLHWEVGEQKIYDLVAESRDMRSSRAAYLVLSWLMGALITFKLPPITTKEVDGVIIFALILVWCAALFFLQRRVIQRAYRRECRSRSCAICGLVDVSPKIPIGGYARPCPACYFQAAWRFANRYNEQAN